MAVPEQVDRDDVMVWQLRCESLEVARVVAYAVEADDPRSCLVTPLVKREFHSDEVRASSESGTISVRRSSRSITSDQITTPSRSMRKVPRVGAPISSSKTP